MHREGIFEKHRQDLLALTAAGATVFAQGVIGPCPEGYAWYVETAYGAVLGNSHTAIFLAAVQIDNTNLPAPNVWDFAGVRAASNAAQTQAPLNMPLAIYVPPAHYLKCYAYGGTLAAADLVTFTAQIAVHQLDPRLIVSPEDERQVRAAYAHLPIDNSVVNQPATAGARATDSPPPHFALNEDEEQPVFSADYRERS